MARRKSRRSGNNGARSGNKNARRASSTARNRSKKSQKKDSADAPEYKLGKEDRYGLRHPKAEIKEGMVYIENTHYSTYARKRDRKDTEKFKDADVSAQALRRKKEITDAGLEGKLKYGTSAEQACARKKLTAIKKEQEAACKAFFGENYQSWVDMDTLNYIHDNFIHQIIVDRNNPFEPTNVPYDSDNSQEAFDRIHTSNSEHANGIKKPGLIGKVKNLFRMLTMMGPQGAFDITLGKYIIDRHNEKTMKSLKEGDKVLGIIHGYHWNGGGFRELVKQAEARGYKVIAPTYDFKLPALDVANSLGKLTKEVYNTTLTRMKLYGQSTGANNLLAYLGNSPSAKLYTESAIAAAPTSSGIGKPRTYAQLTFPGGIPKVDNPKFREGRENVITLNKPESAGVPYMVVAGNDDDLVRAEDSMSNNAWQNTVYNDVNHFDTSGANQGVNEAILDDFERLSPVQTKNIYSNNNTGQHEMIAGATELSNNRVHKDNEALRSADVMKTDRFEQLSYASNVHNLADKPAMNYMVPEYQQAA